MTACSSRISCLCAGLVVAIVLQSCSIAVRGTWKDKVERENDVAHRNFFFTDLPMNNPVTFQRYSLGSPQSGPALRFRENALIPLTGKIEVFNRYNNKPEDTINLLGHSARCITTDVTKDTNLYVIDDQGSICTLSFEERQLNKELTWFPLEQGKSVSVFQPADNSLYTVGRDSVKEWYWKDSQLSEYQSFSILEFSGVAFSGGYLYLIDPNGQLLEVRAKSNSDTGVRPHKILRTNLELSYPVNISILNSGDILIQDKFNLQLVSKADGSLLWKLNSSQIGVLVAKCVAIDKDDSIIVITDLGKVLHRISKLGVIEKTISLDAGSVYDPPMIVDSGYIYIFGSDVVCLTHDLVKSWELALPQGMAWEPVLFYDGQLLVQTWDNQLVYTR